MTPRRAKVLSEGNTSPGALRRHLIVVTQHLLEAHGLTGLTTRQIAREAQVADGVLYNHFANKDDLVLTALGERATELIGAFRASIPEPGSATLEENVTTLAQATLDLYAGTVPLVTGLFGQERLLHGFFAGVHGVQGMQTVFAAVVEYVRDEQTLRRASDDVDPVAIAELLFGACQLRALVALMGPAEGRVKAADLDTIVGALLRALQPAA
jgi:AcrR family transcriptional regulator